jgi:peptidoglycan/LPS O-acetylase OafA/YrhL
VLLGISYLLAFFSEHLLKKRFQRLKRRFARRAPIEKP